MQKGKTVNHFLTSIALLKREKVHYGMESSFDVNYYDLVQIF